jgi:hypothetical protein
MLSRCLHGMAGALRASRVSRARWRRLEGGTVHGLVQHGALPHSTPDAHCSTLDAEPQSQRRRVRSPACSVQSPDAAQGRAGQGRAASQGRQQKEAGPVGPGTCKPGTRRRRRAVVGRA